MPIILEKDTRSGASDTAGGVMPEDDPVAPADGYLAADGDDIAPGDKPLEQVVDPADGSVA